MFANFQTPNTPNTPSTPKDRLLRAVSTPITGPKQQRERLIQANTPCTPTDRVLRSTGTPTSPAQRTGTPKSENKGVFRTPMSFKPRLVGNKPVPSPSRQEIWKQQLGLTGEWCCLRFRHILLRKKVLTWIFKKIIKFEKNWLWRKTFFCFCFWL